MKTELQISELIELFIADQDVKPNSRDLYKRNITSFFRWCDATGRDKRKLQRSDIIAYKEYLFDKEYSSLTIDSYLTSARKFFQWLAFKDYYINIADGVKNPKRYKGFKKDPLTLVQIGKLLKSPFQEQLKGKRDIAILNLMLRAGLRSSEVCKLMIKDIVEQGLWVERKGSRGQKTFIPITDKTVDSINNYLVNRKDFKDSEALFPALSRNNTSGKLSPQALSQIIKGYLKQIGIESKRVTAHSLRHTAAIQLIKAGADLLDVQLFLGHMSPNVTQIYIRAIQEEKRLKNNSGKLLDTVF